MSIACTAAVTDAQAGPSPALPVKSFSHPDRVRYDAHCMTIDGRDTFVFSGAFHYFRVPKALWPDRFARIKAAGFNAVETYAPWNWHERERPSGLDDDSKTDLTDLRDWLKMAHEQFGLYTIVRPGPYICAEWAGGGFPQWLWGKQPDGFGGRSWVRSDEATYLAWCKHWYDRVLPVIAAEQITRKPPGAKGVILVQIENEYDLYHLPAPEARTNQLRFLYETARADGIDVPIFTCWTRQGRGSRDPELSQVFDASNCYDRWNLNATAKTTRELRATQPNAPVMISELQGGWFASAGGKLSQDQDGIDAAQINAITLTAVANGATLLNYYMLVGGSNTGAWGGGDTLQSYDYFAPIREAGGVGEKYAAVQAIGAFLARHGAALARSEPVATAASLPDRLQVTVRRGGDGQTYVFCRNPQPDPMDRPFTIGLSDGGSLKIAHRLPGRMISVLTLPPGKTDSADGTWWCEPAAVPARPKVPAAVRIEQALTRAETGPTHWRPIAPDAALVRAKVDAIEDVVYRATPTLSADQVAQFPTLRVGDDEPGRLVLRVNGQIVLPHRTGRSTDFPVGGAMREGPNTLELLYENHGVPGFGDALATPPGVRSMALVTPGTSGQALEQWRVALVRPGPTTPEAASEFDDSQWDRIVLDAKTFEELAAAKQPGHPPLTYPAAAILNDKPATAVFRTELTLSEADLKTGIARIELNGVDDAGELFVNGKSAARSNDWRKPLVADIGPLVHAGRNVIAVKVTNTAGDGGLNRPIRFFSDDHALPLHYELGTDMAGMAGRWYATDDPQAWTPVKLDTATPLAAAYRMPFATTPAKSLGKWYRVEFDPPALAPGTWAPYQATINASGDGFVYLNGHDLGRYYDAGPQRQFYLPEPWLKTGPGETNVLTIALHPVTSEPTLHGLSVGPDAEQAETRATTKPASREP